MKDDATGEVRYGIFPTTGVATFAEAATADISSACNTPTAPRIFVGKRSVVYRHYGKRVFDVACILLALPFALFLIGFCALALWFEGGKPFYTQQRLGAGGKKFSILKLRSMVHNADQVLEDYLARDPEMRREWDKHQKITNDPRITPMGRILRKTSLDELPQLFNVLRGDMSLIGPRPMMPDQLSLYGRPNAYFALKPGITGLWQVGARNNERFSYRNEVDAEYERTISFRTDMVILFKTVGVVLRPTGK